MIHSQKLYVHVIFKNLKQSKCDYLTQLSILASVASGPIMSSKRRIGVPQYDSINDPHLRDYFERKFSLSSAVSSF